MVLALFVGLLSAELGMRAWLYRRDLGQVQAWRTLAKSQAEEISGPANLGDIIAITPSSDRIYELIPSLRSNFKGVWVETNSFGFRGPELKLQVAPNTVRILGLGDSRMFGWGVNIEECFLSRLETRLNQDPGVRYEIINTGVPGYNTAMEVATLVETGLQFKPDLVLLEIVGNDWSLPNFIAPRNDYMSLKRCYLWDTASGKGGDLEFEGLEPAPLGQQSLGKFEDDPDLVPPQYRHMVGPEGVKRALGRLKKLSQEHGFEVLVLYRATNMGIAETLEEVGLPGYYYTGATKRALEEMGLTYPELPGSVFTLSKLDTHPSSLGHKVVADDFYREFKESGLLERLRQ